MLSKYTNERRKMYKMYITSFDLEIMTEEDTDKIITELFNSFLHRYQEVL